tara:strand:- start:2330 stop:3487 length:1158 start_codon:yes stop_codon:yes gene_type:complete
MNKILYWSPFISKVATVKSVINSADAVNSYLSDKYKAIIIDAVNEWDEFKGELRNKNIEIINLNKNSILNFLKKDGFLMSRIVYFYIFFKSLIPLHNQLRIKKPKYLIVHLITSLPLLLFIFQNYDTRLILRVSGLPKMTFIRKMIWKLASKKIYKITCPTKDTYNDLSKFIFLKDKLVVLNDPIIKSKEIQKIRTKKINISENIREIISNNDFFLSVGRFTKQKNFIFYLKCIPEILKLNNKVYFLFIGQGEDEKIFIETAKKLKILNNIILIKYTDNVHYFMKKSKCLILTSLWEDPGFVLVEAGYNNCQVISSNCPNGPNEIISDDGGYLFKSNNSESLVDTIKSFYNDSDKSKLLKKVKLKKRLKNFTFFHHSLVLRKILN